MGNVTSFKAGTLELMDGTRFTVLGEAIYLLSAAPPYEEVSVDVAGRYPSFQRRQMRAREAPLTVALLRGDALLRRMDFDQVVAAFQPANDLSLVPIRWVESGVIRKVTAIAREVTPGPWFARAVIDLYIPNPIPLVSYPGQVQLTTGLTAYYRLDEPSGTAMIDRLSVNSGTYPVAPTLGVTGALAGDTDTAISMTGTQYGRSSATFTNGSTEMSFACWFKTNDSTASRRTAIAHAGSGSTTYNASLTKESGTPSKLTLRVLNVPTDTTAITSCTSVKTINDNAWHHAVGVIKKGVGASLYVDGALDAAVAHTLSTWVPGAGYAQVGSMNAGEFWAGSLDDVSFWGRALTDDEVAYLYAAGITAL